VSGERPELRAVPTEPEGHLAASIRAGLAEVAAAKAEEAEAWRAWEEATGRVEAAVARLAERAGGEVWAFPAGALVLPTDARCVALTVRGPRCRNWVYDDWQDYRNGLGLSLPTERLADRLLRQLCHRHAEHGASHRVPVEGVLIPWASLGLTGPATEHDPAS
jgi:hypothetical protein